MELKLGSQDSGDRFRRRHAVWSMIALALAVLAVCPALAQLPEKETREPFKEPADPMPELIWATDGYHVKYPLFVSADRALLPSGKVDPALFSEGAVKGIENFVIEADFTECNGGIFSPGQIAASANWEDLGSIVDDSDFVVLGRISGAKKGFRHLFPGTVFRIQPDRWLKSEADWREKFMFIPSVEMEFGGKSMCFRDPYYAELPQVGWQVLILFENSYDNRENPLFYVDPAQIIVIRPDGKASLPRFLRERQRELMEKSGSDVVETVERLIQGNDQ